MNREFETIASVSVQLLSSVEKEKPGAWRLESSSRLLVVLVVSSSSNSNILLPLNISETTRDRAIVTIERQ